MAGAPVRRRRTASTARLPSLPRALCKFQPARVIDLNASGIDGGLLFNGGGDPMILFSPNGSVDRVYLNSGATEVTQPIFLLVGKREKIPTPTKIVGNLDTYANYEDLTNLWVVINPQTGMVYTDYVGSKNGNNPPTDFNDARGIARDALTMGGR